MSAEVGGRLAHRIRPRLSSLRPWMPVAANGVKQPDITPLEFMLGMMADPKVDPSLRFKAAQASAMYVHPKPTTSPTDPAGAKIIEGDDDALHAKFEAACERIDELSGLRRFIQSFDHPPPPPLTEAEKLELAELEAWYAAAPDYLKAPRGWFPDFCVGGQHREPAYDDPAERRQRLLREHQAPAERKGAPLLEDSEVVEEPQDEGLIWPADLRRDDDVLKWLSLTSHQHDSAWVEASVRPWRLRAQAPHC